MNANPKKQVLLINVIPDWPEDVDNALNALRRAGIEPGECEVHVSNDISMSLAQTIRTEYLHPFTLVNDIVVQSSLSKHLKDWVVDPNFNILSPISVKINHNLPSLLQTLIGLLLYKRVSIQISDIFAGSLFIIL